MTVHTTHSPSKYRGTIPYPGVCKYVLEKKPITEYNQEYQHMGTDAGDLRKDLKAIKNRAICKPGQSARV